MLEDWVYYRFYTLKAFWDYKTSSPGRKGNGCEGLQSKQGF